MPLEGGEDDSAFLWLVAVLEQVTGHAFSVWPRRRPDIGAPP